MPTRRILEVIILTTFLMHPVMGLARLWVRKALGAEPQGSVLHSVAEAATIPTAVA